MLTFDETAHRYFWEGRPVPGASELLETVKRPFDQAKWSVHVARRDGLTVPEVLAKWDAKRDAACDRGHELHAAVEAVLRGCSTSCSLPEFRNWLEWWEEAQKSLSPVVTEHRMCSPDLWVAGTMDALFVSKKTRLWHIFDWKQNQQIRTCNKYGDRLLPPFEDLHDCERDIYALQCSIYRLMAEEEAAELFCPIIPGPFAGLGADGFGDSWLLHLSPEAVTPYWLPDLRSRVRDWLLNSAVR